MEIIQNYLIGAEELLLIYGGKIILAMLVLIFGLWLIGHFLRVINRVMDRREMDLSLRPFLLSILNIILKVMLAISVISILGVETTSFIAVLGSVGLAIGLALQGSLSNFAGGVIILTVKPFKVGDFIMAMGQGGTVSKITILTTILKTPDNQIVYVPNGKLAADVIVNYSEETTRRLVLTYGIHYDDDIAKAREVMKSVIEMDERVLKEPAHSIVVAQLGDSAVNIDLRVWCRKEDYWDLRFNLLERIKLKFDEENITIPFPQTDVHIHN